jgi:cyclomaltodextrinase / maltogenic alpha-amylase / neopullulanase
MKRVWFFPAVVLAVSISCTNQSPSDTVSSVPEWVKEVIWYQVFVERFRNGDPSNDPTVDDLQGSYPGEFPGNWSVTPWGHDWYSHEPWLEDVKAGNFHSKIQARRYGGDLQGVLDKLDYLHDLGITAIYFNPLNDSPSLHKYDAASYIHIDRNFGPDPQGDVALMKTEDPADPSTWKWTAADSMFLRVIQECHDRNIKVILDYSWNHTGPNFWALSDIRKKGKESPYSDWYNIHEFDDPATTADEFRYEGWGGGNPWMPVFRKDIIPPGDSIMPFEGDLHSESLKEHIFNVTRRWLDPDNDDDPSDGVDGFRLDVAGEIPMGFWRDYRKVVRAVNPEAYLVGEIWWLEWPDRMLDPGVFLKGDQFDAIMNYRWYRIARGFFGQAEPVLTPSGFVSEIARIDSGIGPDYLGAMMNIAASHDSPRLSTSLFNKGMDKYRAKPSDDPEYKIHKPDELTRKEQMLLLVHQFTWMGAPHIWNGDEMAMWGADDPDCRKPLVWDDIDFADERAHYYPDMIRPVDVVEQDTALMAFYKKLIRMRKENPVLSNGEYKFIIADDSRMLLAYTRKSGKEEVVAVFNRSSEKQTLTIRGSQKGRHLVSAGEISTEKDMITLQPLSAIVILL